MQETGVSTDMLSKHNMHFCVGNAHLTIFRVKYPVFSHVFTMVFYNSIRTRLIEVIALVHSEILLDQASLRDLRTTNPHHNKDRIQNTNRGQL